MYFTARCISHWVVPESILTMTAPDETQAGIYIHIPFCRAKCAYCDFASYAGLEALADDYVDALSAEITHRATEWSDTILGSLFFGGGTPTLLPPAAIAHLIAHCRAALSLADDAEITVEANPGTIDAESLTHLRDAGVNRLSLGVQSLHDDELAMLGRIHSAAEAVAAVEAARSAGLSNISLDLIYGLPGQTLARWEDTVRRALALEPEHLSLYGLSVEAGTPLEACIECGLLPAPDDDLAADMYERAGELLDQAGYAQYEISNWARRSAGDVSGRIPALASRHNLIYWRNERYLGVGAAAHSYDGQVRRSNVVDPPEYIRRIRAGQSPVDESETADLDRRMADTMMLGLRLNVGVDEETFSARFGLALREAYGAEIDRLVDEGLLEADDRGVRLTPHGRLLGNRVFAEFLR
jgi:oxygen-independent coproporphyrinogen-3 oxidase